MDRNRLRLNEEEVAAEFGRVLQLLQQARLRPRFKQLMAEAGREGLNWVEALEYVLNPSSGSDHAATTPTREPQSD